METIFKVLSNINHNGTPHAKGTFFQAERAEFEHLVADGVLKVCEGAKTIGEAVEQDAEAQDKAVAAKEAEEAASAAQDTWGPTKPGAEAPAAPAPADTTAAPAADAPVVVGAGDVAPAAGAETGENL